MREDIAIQPSNCAHNTRAKCPRSFCFEISARSYNVFGPLQKRSLSQMTFLPSLGTGHRLISFCLGVAEGLRKCAHGCPKLDYLDQVIESICILLDDRDVSA